MFDHRTLPSGQWYIDPMQEVGLIGNRDGVCYGVSNKAIDAILLRDIKTFNDRFYELYNVISSGDPSSPTQKKFTAALEAIRKKSLPLIQEAKREAQKDIDEIRENEKGLSEETLNARIQAVVQDHIRIKLLNGLTKAEQLISSAPLFLAAVDVYFQGKNYHPFFERESIPLTQENTFAAQLVNPVLLEEPQFKGRVNVDRFAGIYSYQEVLAYLQSLRATLEGSPPFPAPFALFLVNAGHAITIGYDTLEKTWIVADPNHMPALLVKDDKVVAEKILKGFFANLNENVAFSTEVFVAGNHAVDAKNYVENWRNEKNMLAIHEVTVKKAQLLDVRKGSWLYSAVIMGEIATVKRMFELKAVSVDQLYYKGHSLLHLAAESGWPDIVDYLLEQGANPNIKVKNDELGATPLESACIAGREDIVKTLLSKGAKGSSAFSLAASGGYLGILQILLKEGLFQLSEEGPAAMITAVRGGHYQVVKALLEWGIDANKIFYSPTLLALAVDHGHEDIVALLIEHGAKVDVKATAHQSLLHAAVAKEKIAVVAKLLGHVDPNEKDSSGDTPLHMAVRLGNDDIVRLLLDYSSNPSDLLITNNKKLTAFETAIKEGRLEIVKNFIAHQYPLNPRAIQLAASAGHLSIVKELIEAGVKPTQLAFVKAAGKNHIDVMEELLAQPGIEVNKGVKKYGGLTALHAAAGAGHKEAMRWLLKRNANINQFTTEGITPLSNAADLGQTAVVKELLARGATVSPSHEQNEIVKEFFIIANIDFTLTDAEGDALLHKVARQGNTAMLELILDKKGADPFVTNRESENIMHIAANRGDLPMLMMLESVNKKLKNLGDKSGNTPLHIAARAGDTKMVAFLVQSGAHPNLKNDQGYTPLHIAAEISSLAMVKEIMKLNPDLDLKNKEGETPLHIAIKEKSAQPVITILSANGANLLAEDKKGNTPLSLALQQKNFTAIIAMLSVTKNIPTEVVGNLQPYKSQIGAVLLKELKSLSVESALERLSTIMQSENALQNFLRSSETSRWHHIFSAKKETPEWNALTALQDTLRLPRQGKQIK